MATATILTPKFRGSYVNVFKPRPVSKAPDAKLKYGITIVLPKDSKDTKTFLAKLRAEFKKAMIEKFGKELPEDKCKHFPIRDGDEMTDDDGNLQPEFENAWIIPAKNEDQPGILVMDEDGTKRPATSPREIYSGAMYHASLTVFAWGPNAGGKGVSVSLSGILKVEDGEQIGGRRFSENEFDNVTNDEPPL